MSLLLNFVISRSAIQLRFVFEKDTKTWSEVKEVVSKLLGFNSKDLFFALSSSSSSDESFINNLASSFIEVSCPRYQMLVQNFIANREGVPVFVKNSAGQSLRIPVNLEKDTCLDLKNIIDAFYGIIASQQCLVFGNIRMEDDRLLSSYNVQENSEIFFMFRILDGISPEVSLRDHCFSHLPSIIVYDSVKDDIVLTSRPYLFRTEISCA